MAYFTGCWRETTAKEYYGPALYYPAGSNGCVNMKSVQEEGVNCLPPVCKREGSVAPCWVQLLAHEGQLHMQLQAHTF